MSDFSGSHMPGIIHYRIYYHFQLTRGVNTFYNTLFPIIGYAGQLSP